MYALYKKKYSYRAYILVPVKVFPYVMYAFNGYKGLFKAYKGKSKINNI